MTKGTGERLAWAEMMRFGLGVLRLQPEAFWQMTPVEFRHALEGAGVIAASGVGRMDRNALARLMAQFPDRSKETIDDIR